MKSCIKFYNIKVKNNNIIPNDNTYNIFNNNKKLFKFL